MEEILTLKDIDKLEIHRVYRVGNLKVFKDSDNPEFVWSKYPIEEMWHSFYKTDDFFKKIENLPLEKTEMFMNKDWRG